ncbi:hypothetical protein IGI37_003515 [Enterococcus sp. AZ194]|uniref:DUF624 domain-containing protein n=1 Tax=Enterococcus sp. AZ194 TaxID=2774629 RepID=UPI003F22C493
MRGLMDPSKNSYKICVTAVDLYLLNMLFIITSGFGLFFGPALIALYSVMFNEIQTTAHDLPTKRLQNYLLEYRTNFVRGIILEGFLLMFVFIGVTSFICTRLLVGLLMYVSVGGLFIFGMILFSWGLLVFPYTARYSNSIFQTFKVCFQIAVLNSKPMLYVVGGLLVFLVIGSMNDVFFSLSFWLVLLFGFSGAATVNSRLFLPVFIKYET